MKLSRYQESKIDPLLQETLLQANGGEFVRAVVTVKTNVLNTTYTLSSGNFSTRQEYRQALIKERQESIKEDIDNAVNALKELSLTASSSTISPVLVVQGAAADVLRSLDLDIIEHASLDRIIGLPEIAPSAYVDYLSNLYIQTLGNEDISPKDKEIIWQASEQYILRYQSEYGEAETFSMDRRLESVYTPVQLLEQPDYLYTGEIDYFLNKKNNLIVKENYFPSDHNRRKWTEVDAINSHKLLMIFGVPGIGKSTFLKKIGLESFKGNQSPYNFRSFPIFISLKQYNSDSLMLEDMIAEILKSNQLPLAGEFISNALSTGKLLLIFDGLDELAQKFRSSFLQKLQNFLTRFPHNRFVISCRTANWQVSLIDFKCLEISRFSDKQVKQFIKTWFSSRKSNNPQISVNCCRELLESKNHKSVVDIARNPLILTLFCLVYEKHKSLPRNRVLLYKEVLTILLEKWWSTKGHFIGEMEYQFNESFEIEMLSMIAYDSFVSGEFYIQRRKLVDLISKFLTNKKIYSELDVTTILDSIMIQQGILVGRAKDYLQRENDLYSFSHLTFHEYFAACHAAENDCIEQLVKQHLYDIHWKEVFLLLSEILEPEPQRLDKYLVLINEQIHRFTQSDLGEQYLIPLLKWSENVTSFSNKDSDLLGRKFFAISFACANAYAYSYADVYARRTREAFSLAYSSDDVAINSAQKLSYKYSLTHCHALARSYASNNLLSIYSNAYRLIYAFALSKAYYHTSIFGIPNIHNYSSSITEFINYARSLQSAMVFNNQINIPSLISRLDNLRKCIPSDNSSISEHREYSKAIIGTWLTEFYIDPFVAQLDRIPLEEIGQKYFYPIWLMVKCKNSFIHSSSETWKTIEKNILSI